LENADAEIAVPDAGWPNLRRTVFLPLAGTIVLLLFALGLAALWSEKRSVVQGIARDADAAVRLFDLGLAGDVDTLQIAAAPILSDPAVLERFTAGDREGVLALVQRRFNVLKEQHAIIEMLFADADRVVVLRTHQPDSYADVIDRVTMLEAQRTGQPASGLELGVLGEPTLRVVSPLRHEGRVVGYLGLGREVEYHTEEIRRILGIELHVLIRKDLLVEDKWLEGQALLGREVDWERFDEYVAVGSAEGGEEIGMAIDEVLPLISHEGAESERIQLANGYRLAIGARPLLDTSGRQVGLLVVGIDATASVIAFRRTLLGFFAAFVVFAGTTVLLLGRVVRRAERGLWHAEAIELEAKTRLEERVRERTAQLQVQTIEREKAEAQLRQAQKMEVIGQLTGGVAHDFNNLLAIIMGDLENLRTRLADDDLEELIAGAWEATERGTDLVARLLAVSRKQPLSPRSVDSNKLVQGLMPLLERAVSRSVRIEAQVHYEPDLWECFVDPSQLENLILNLAINGRDAMPDGGTLSIETNNRRVSPSDAHEWGIEPGDYIRMTVTDTGMGMTSEVLVRAFDPFFTTKEVGQGSGLGLSIAHGMLKQSGGTVLLESTVGVGTTVTLLLPRTPVATADYPTGGYSSQ
jgi:signal transduction histidine kinase